jgi:hypothetical protein
VAVTFDQVRAQVNASKQSLPDDKVAGALNAAVELVAKHIGATEIPSTVVDRAVLLVAVEELNQDKAPNGVLNQFFDAGTGDASATPVRIGRDPMKPAYPILAPWVSGRFFCA